MPMESSTEPSPTEKPPALTRRPLTLPSDPSSLPAEHYEIRGNITDDQAIIYDLRSQQNTCIRICQLPPEILSLIFTTYALSAFYGEHPLRWIKISHVCRHFRAVALEFPSLWSNIYLGSLEGARALLTRSRSVNIVIKSREIKSHQHAHEGLQALEEALAQMHRIQTLDLHDMSPSELDAIVASLGEGAPELQSLSVHKCTNCSASARDSYALPLNFIHGGAPRLRHIQLVNCALPWQQWQGVPKFFTSGLTVLMLSTMSFDSNIWSGEKPLLSHLIDLLEALPALQRLELHNVLPTTAANTMAAVRLATRIISFSQLSKLVLRGQYLECLDLLRCLSFPRTTEIGLECDKTPGRLDVCSIVMQTIFNCCGVVFKPKRLCVLDSLPRTPGFWIFMWDEVDRKISNLTDQSQYCLNFLVNYNIQPITEILATRKVLHTMFDSVDFSSLRKLDVALQWDKRIWGRYFGSVPNLTHIWVSHIVAIDLAEAMVPQQTIGTQSEVRSKMYFPHLRTLGLSNVEFGKQGLDVETLRDTLMLRAAYGSDLHELYIQTASGFDEVDEDLLEVVVAVVCWDGVVDSEDEDSRDHFEEDETESSDEDEEEY